MSLMRINHVRSELRKLTHVIENLVKNYSNDFHKYDSEFQNVNESFAEREEAARESENWDLHWEIVQEKRVYKEPLDNLKSLAQFQNELMLVKHAALMENMIVNIFWCLTKLLHNHVYETEYFIKKENFSDCLVSVNKIREMTKNKFDFKKINEWYLCDTIRQIRNSIAHGDPLFLISFKRANKFNKEINVITLYSEVNKCDSTNRMFPSKFDPTYDANSRWFCHLSSNLSGLKDLNKKCIDFVESTREQYLLYGEEIGLSSHELYGCTPFSQKEVASPTITTG